MGLSKKDNLYRWALLFAGTLSFLVLGFVFGWSVLLKPLEADFGWNRAQVTVAYTMSMLCLYAGMLTNGVITRRLKGKFTAFLGVALVAVSYIVTSLTGFFDFGSSASLWIFYIFYGLCLGFGSGFCYSTWLALAPEWFPERPGLATGVSMMGYGFGGLVFAPLATSLLEKGVLWHQLLLGTGIVATVILTASLIFAKPAPQFLLDAKVAKPGGKSDLVGVDTTPGKMLISFLFWAFSIWKIVMNGTATAVIGQAAEIATDAGASAAFAATCVSLLSIGNGTGRVLSGIIIDKFGMARTMVGISTVLFLTQIGFLVSYSQGIYQLLPLITPFFGFYYGAGVTFNCMFVRGVWGAKNYKANIGCNSISSIPAVLFASSFISLVKSGTGSYLPFFQFSTPVSAMTIVGAVGILALARKTAAKAHKEAGI